MNALARICVNRRLGWLFVILISVPAVLGYRGYRIGPTLPSGWAPPEAFATLEKAAEEFAGGGSLVLVMQCDEFFEANRIQAIQNVVAQIRELDKVQHVAWMGDIPKVNLLGRQRLLLPDPAAEISSEVLAKAKEQLLAHPLAKGNLISADGKTCLVLVDTHERSNIKIVRKLLEEQLRPVDIETKITGTLALYEIHDRALAEDNIRIQLLAYSLVGILLVTIFRRPAAIIVAGSGAAVGVFWTLGFMLLTGQQNNELAKIILPVMITMIGFTDGVHVFVRMRQLRLSGLSSNDAVFESILQTGPACFLTSLTTAIGFGSLMLSQSEMIAGFGRISAIGVVMTFLAVILVTPLLSITRLGRYMHIDAKADSTSQLATRILGVVNVSSTHPRLITSIGILITSVCLYACTQLTLDDRVSDRVPKQSEEWQAMKLCDTQVGGIRALTVTIQWPEESSRKEIWQVIGRCEEILEGQPLLGPPISIENALSVIQVPKGKDSSVLVNRLPERLKRQFYRADLRKTRIAARMEDQGIARLQPVFDDIQLQLRKLESEYPGYSLEFLSDVVVEGSIVSQLIREMMQSLMMAAFIIFGVLAISFRSLRIGLISIIPNIMPLAVSGALQLFLGNSLAIAGACSFAVCLGIAVDDTIHYLVHFNHERKRGSSPVVANRKTFVTVGSALLVTTVVMTAGLGTVLTSQLPPFVNFATMACTTLAVALPADLLFLPALLTLFPGKQDKDKAAEDLGNVEQST